MEYCLEMTNYQLSISLLQDFSVLKDFDCGIEAMNKFIRNDFQMSVENHFCEAYCVYSDKELIGLFALSFDSIDSDNDDKEDKAVFQHLFLILITTTKIPFIQKDVIQLLI